jgi:hypothetical protein
VGQSIQHGQSRRVLICHEVVAELAQANQPSDHTKNKPTSQLVCCAKRKGGALPWEDDPERRQILLDSVRWWLRG